jgi:Holliday junction resolvase RusA-like endonuclease
VSAAEVIQFLETRYAFSAFCPGSPVTQGSSKAFLTNLAAVRKGATPIIVVTSDNTKLKGWRKAMAQCFGLHARTQGIREPLDGPLAAQFVFIMPRLAGHPKTINGRYWPDTGLDLDKLIRAAMDSLKDAKVIVDDSRVCLIERPMKHYALLHETPGVLVRIWQLPRTEARG